MTVTGQNGNSYYWSGTSSYSTEAYYLFCWGGEDPGKDFGDPDRYLGMSVRPVKDSE